MSSAAPSAAATGGPDGMLSGTVKQVLSGDSLVLIGSRRPDGPPPTRTVILAGLVAPRLAIKTANFTSEDEPCAFQAREFLRKKVIGNAVSFKITHKDRDREFVVMLFKGADLAVQIVEEGLAKLRFGKDVENLPNFADLQDAQDRAKEAQKGIWGSKVLDPIRCINWLQNDAESAKAFAATYKNEKLPAIIENIRDGGCYRVYFPRQLTHGTVLLTGVQVDGYRRSAGYSEPTPDPFAEEGKFFTEIRLLNRDVTVRIEGADDYGNLHGTIYHPNGNISQLLLKNGFARINENSVKNVEDPAGYRAAQTEAQGLRVRKWRSYLPQAEAPVTEFTGKIVEVVSGDCVVALCENKEDDELEEKRLYIASIRCPKMGTRSRPAEPWSYESKEFARKLLIGKPFTATVEYSREPISTTNAPPPPSDSSGKMHFVSLKVEGKSQPYAELVISEGLARTISHRADDPRASNYDQLCTLEKEAEAAGKGLHSKNPAPVHRIVELFGPDNVNLAKSWEKTLQRLGEFEARVEHVFNGGRFRLYAPTENISFAFVLGGVRVPQLSRAGSSAGNEQYAEEALQFSRENYMQRNVRILVDVCDRGGNFIGTMWKGKTCCNVALVERGLGEVTDMARPALKGDLLKAQEAAVEQRLGIFVHGIAQPVAEEAKLGAANDRDTVCKTLECKTIVTTVDSIVDFYLQENRTEEIEQLQDLVNDHVKSLTEINKIASSYSSTGLPVPGSKVLAQFSEDNAWYRAVVESVNKQSVQVTVRYIDFGNCETRSIKHLLQGPPQLFNKHPPMAHYCALAGVRPPTVIMEGESRDFFLETASPNDLFECFIESITKTGQPKKNLVFLYRVDKDGVKAKQSLNEEILEKGYGVYCDKTVASDELKEGLKAAEAVAKKSHLNAWRFGDVGMDDSDDEDFPNLKNPKSAKRTAGAA